MLFEGSPAINAGIPLSEVTNDFEGKSRSGKLDIGAFEYGSSGIRAGTILKDRVLVMAYPNPAMDLVKIVWLGSNIAGVQVRILSVGGQVVRTLETGIAMGMGYATWDCLDGLSRRVSMGTYVIALRTVDGREFTQTVMLNR